MRRSYSIYKHQMERADKHHVELNFSLDRLRELIRVALDIGVCWYCGGKLTERNFSLDHRQPIERGGSYDIENNIVVCDPCNRAKGTMTTEEFMALRTFLRERLPEVMNNILGRLKAGAAVVRLRFVRR